MSETKFTPGPWEMWTSNSWRRIRTQHSGSVCEPVTQNDGHPDLLFSNGGPDGPDARLILAAPELYEALAPVLRGANEADYYCPDDVADDHTVLISFTIGELRAARAALAKAQGANGSPQATSERESSQ